MSDEKPTSSESFGQGCGCACIIIALTFALNFERILSILEKALSK